MGRIKRMQKRAKRIEAKKIEMRPPIAPAIWAGEPNARELELDRKIEALDRKHQTVGLTEAERIEGVRLHNELLMESQRRSGVTLIKITPNAANDAAHYDASNYFRVMKNAQMLIDAGMPLENAMARAIEDERWRQQQSDAEVAEDQTRGFTQRIMDIFRSNN